MGHFWQEPVERGREEGEALPSLYDRRSSVDRFPMGQGLKLEYSTRATCVYQKLQVSPRFTQKVREVKKLRVQEVFAGLSRGIAHASRGKEPSYSGSFSI